ncbi:unnamed protein product [Durusdinium trenchii]|uniref:Apple domain-containing protein n=1 Tax=Durusdinium trenchii TaxID=1381693 RepID=A0ABP0SPS1_9DINO
MHEMSACLKLALVACLCICCNSYCNIFLEYGSSGEHQPTEPLKVAREAIGMVYRPVAPASDMGLSEGAEESEVLQESSPSEVTEVTSLGSWPLLLAFISFLLVFCLSVLETTARHEEITDDYRNLQGMSMEKQLQDFVLHGDIPGDCVACRKPIPASKSICGHTPGRRLQVETQIADWLGEEEKRDFADIKQQLQDYVSGKPVKGQCPESKPVVSISMMVSLKDTQGMDALFMPMLVRAATRSISTVMQVPSEVVSVHLKHPAEKRLLSLEDAVGLTGQGSSVVIVAEVTAPPQQAMKDAMSPDFLSKFKTQVFSAMTREGAAAGAGNFHKMAHFEDPTLEEKGSLDMEGGFESTGFGTKCASPRNAKPLPGHMEASPFGRVIVQFFGSCSEAKKVDSLRACAAACNGESGCHGFQFGHTAQSCQLWKMPICKGEEALGPSKLECFRKCD